MLSFRVPNFIGINSARNLTIDVERPFALLRVTVSDFVRNRHFLFLVRYENLSTLPLMSTHVHVMESVPIMGISFAPWYPS